MSNKRLFDIPKISYKILHCKRIFYLGWYTQALSTLDLFGAFAVSYIAFFVFQRAMTNLEDPLTDCP